MARSKHFALALLPMVFLLCLVGHKATKVQTEANLLNQNGAEHSRNSICYAFLAQGNLFLRCKGTLMQITKRDNVNEFAVTQTGTAMVLMRQTGTRKLNDGLGSPIMSLQVVPLGPGGEERNAAIGNQFGSLVASCGTALFLYRTTKDLVNGRDVEFQPYDDFRCSSNRKEIAGQVELDINGDVVTGLPKGNDHSALVSGLPPNTENPLVADSGSEAFAYDISPNGEYLAYSMPNELCLVEEHASNSCVSGIQGLRDISVSDSGDIFFTEQTGETCNYRDPFHISLTPRVGYSDSGPCIAVAVLQRGKRSPKTIEPLARQSQWLTSEAADALLKWKESNHSFE